MKACKGKNCGCTDGVSHSKECLLEYEKCCDPVGYHIEHGGWKCDFCGRDGQDNQQFNQFCSYCHKHR